MSNKEKAKQPKTHIAIPFSQGEREAFKDFLDEQGFKTGAWLRALILKEMKHTEGGAKYE